MPRSSADFGACSPPSSRFPGRSVRRSARDVLALLGPLPAASTRAEHDPVTSPAIRRRWSDTARAPHLTRDLLQRHSLSPPRRLLLLQRCGPEARSMTAVVEPGGAHRAERADRTGSTPKVREASAESDERLRLGSSGSGAHRPASRRAPRERRSCFGESGPPTAGATARRRA